MTVDLDHIEALARAATPGPWRTGRSSARHGGYVYIMPSNKSLDSWVIEPAGYIDEDDAAYIAAANPATVLEIIDRVRELERQRDEARYLSIELAYQLHSYLADSSDDLLWCPDNATDIRSGWLDTAKEFVKALP